MPSRTSEDVRPCHKNPCVHRPDSGRAWTLWAAWRRARHRKIWTPSSSHARLRLAWLRRQLQQLIRANVESTSSCTRVAGQALATREKPKIHGDRPRQHAKEERGEATQTSYMSFRAKRHPPKPPPDVHRNEGDVGPGFQGSRNPLHTPSAVRQPLLDVSTPTAARRRPQSASNP